MAEFRLQHAHNRREPARSKATIPALRLMQTVRIRETTLSSRTHCAIRINRSLVDYLENFEALITEYNAGSRNIEKLFNELLNLSRSLTDEQQRHVREQLSEEELTVFDILTHPDPELTETKRAVVKMVAILPTGSAFVERQNSPRHGGH
ncbi:MAG: type I restriction enzyme endonuclease domain-containing protein [Opitutaceae bacterium]